MSAVKAYAKRVKECGLKSGDFVRLTRKAKSFEDGWDNVWPLPADDWVGHILRVDCIRNNSGQAW